MRNIIKTGQRFKSIKSGLSTASKYPEKPMMKEDMPIRVRAKIHRKNHPNDKNERRTDKSVQLRKKNEKQTKREKALKEFYKTHVYTWVSHDRRAWVSIPSTEEEE